MDVPTSEVGYTIATTRRETTKVRKNMWRHWGGGIIGLFYLVYRVLVGKHEGKSPLGRPRLRWENNIKMEPQEVGYGGMDWIDVAQDRDRWRALVNAVMNLRVA